MTTSALHAIAQYYSKLADIENDLNIMSTILNDKTDFCPASIFETISCSKDYINSIDLIMYFKDYFYERFATLSYSDAFALLFSLSPERPGSLKLNEFLRFIA